MVSDRKQRGSSRRRPEPSGPHSAPHSADADLPTDLKDCPVCGHTMREHSFERGAHDTILTCPVPHPGAWDRDAFEPVNEFGMVLRRQEAEPSREEGDRQG